MASSHMVKVVLVNGHNAKRPFAHIGIMQNYATRFSGISSRNIIHSRRPIVTTSTSNCSAIPTATQHADAIETDNPLQELARREPPVSRIDFADATSAHGSKSTFELLRAIAVFRACQLPFLVKHAESLLGLSKKVLGSTITNAILKRTFFGHFCAGENSADMKPVIGMLQRNNIGPILDYAAESEGDEVAGTVSGGNIEGVFTKPPFNQPARVYDYKSENECDRHVSIFKSCIRSVRDVSPHGFAALKVTALGNPELLQRMSTMIVEVKNLFRKFDEKGTGLISRGEFVRCYE